MYDVGGNRFLLGECFDRMREIADGSIDMVLADLPYGTTQNKWDCVLPLDALWREYWRVCRPGAAVVLTAAQPFTSALVMSQPGAFRYDWVWEKRPSGHLNAKTRPMPEHESVLVFSKNGTPLYFPQGTVPTRRPRGAKDNSKSTTYRDSGTAPYVQTVTNYPTSIIRVTVPAAERGAHPTQKPVALFEYLIKTYTNPDALVLDNTAGSGTTAIAALNTGRRFVCIEREPEYYWPAVARVMDATARVSA